MNDMQIQIPKSNPESAEAKEHPNVYTVIPANKASRGYLEGVALTAEELARARDAWGWSGLHEVAGYSRLNQIKGGVTAEQLAAVRTDEGWTALHLAAKRGCLDQIEGGVTAEQLASVKDNKGRSALHSAMYNGTFNQIRGGVTADQLLADRDHKGRSALMEIHGEFGLVRGGVTSEQLAQEAIEDGYTGLHMAADCGLLGEIKGGVTAMELAGAKNVRGESALLFATVAAPWDVIVGGVPPGLLTQAELDEAFSRTVDHQLHNVHGLAGLGADTTALSEACERAQQEVVVNPKDSRKVARFRNLLRLAADLQVPFRMDPNATAALL